jgi:hypothetical protein
MAVSWAAAAPSVSRVDRDFFFALLLLGSVLLVRSDGIFANMVRTANNSHE